MSDDSIAELFEKLGTDEIGQGEFLYGIEMCGLTAFFRCGAEIRFGRLIVRSATCERCAAMLTLSSRSLTVERCSRVG